MTTREKRDLMRSRERVFKEMAEHYENLAFKCFEAHMKLDEELGKELYAKYLAQRQARMIESGIQALNSAKVDSLAN